MITHVVMSMPAVEMLFVNPCCDRLLLSITSVSNEIPRTIAVNRSYI